MPHSARLLGVRTAAETGVVVIQAEYDNRLRSVHYRRPGTGMPIDSRRLHLEHGESVRISERLLAVPRTKSWPVRVPESSMGAVCLGYIQLLDHPGDEEHVRAVRAAGLGVRVVPVVHAFMKHNGRSSELPVFLANTIIP